ncbi:MAG: 2-phospho-L-lactate transferase [SAR202 cluster bacterium Casp-Chloro-G3]|nr:2-phospho-L-lactate transferase [Chloroflexota bacterium]PKB56816.1 MAG: 2-phospho-L-lactate transferase [SAR202 cluster bacterium Casp-Chloro-G3]
MDGKVLALAGGTGGAKLALGLARILPTEQLVIVVNTGDDECFHGLHVSPDLDTIMYTLAGLVNQETGWGLSGDTFNALDMLRKYDVDTWFNLGDNDLATHVRRTQLLRQGLSLSQVTEELCRRLGVEHQVLPMSDQPVRTVLTTDIGDLPMQTYFVRHRSKPKVSSIAYVGAESAEVAPQFAAAIADADIIVFCPSNPYLSVGPILAVPGVRENLAKIRSTQLRVAVSPIVGGAAIKGPAAKIMAELGHEVSCVGVAQTYQGICDVFVIDEQDAHLAPDIQRMGLKPLVAPTIMNTEADKITLAGRILQLKGN